MPFYLPNLLRVLVLSSILALAFSLTACGEPEQEEDPETCTGLPVCDIGDIQVESCPAGAECYERSFCDVTILCEEMVSCDLPSRCPEGWDEVASCDGVSTECESFETCGGQILCAEDEEVCVGAPICPVDHTEVASCEGEGCVEVEVCEVTIFCEEDEEPVCVEEPECPADYEEVDVCPADATCVELEDCDEEVTICRAPEVCLALPSCDGDDPEVDPCPAGATCYDVEVCGVEITCMSEGPQVCDQYDCPGGYSAAIPCDGEDECFLMSGCGEDVFCGGAPAPDPCDAEAACPAGWGVLENCESQVDVCALAAVCDSTLECAPQELIDALPDVCALECPDGFSAVASELECTTELEWHCLTADVCGTDLYCRADQDADCEASGDVEVCPSGYSAVGDCDYEDNTCFLGLVCDEISYCELD